MRLVLILGLACILGRTAWAQDNVLRDIPYAEGAGSAHRLDLYLPAGGAKPVPLVLYIHGGGWRSGDKGKVPAYVRALVDEGMAVAAVNYRLSQNAKFPAQLFDVKAAVRYLRAHAQAYNIDPKRFGVWGFSAGGHLAALLGTTGDEPALEGAVGADRDQPSAVQAVVNYFGVTSLPDKPVQCAEIGCLFPQTGKDATVSQLLGCDIARCTDEARAASPIAHISAGDAPFLHLHGDQDNIVPIAQSVNFDAALRKAGVPSRLIVVPHQKHGWAQETAFDIAARAFLAKTLRAEPPAVASAAAGQAPL